ncbi:MAG: sigma-70 family RNA polymerase sigma factor [Myxococcota bacterium]|nr:sigma-70 family RNA polymerase sigma factor [Myxococcota bacterium]
METRLEKKLIKRLQAREPKAFDQLVLLFQGQVYNFVFRMLGSTAEAEDLAQEVFISVFKHIDAFRGESSLATWIYRIAANHVKNRRKYHGRRPYDRPLQSASALDPGRSGEGAVLGAGQVSRPDEMVEGLQLERILQEAILALDEEHRMVLVLRDVQNESYDVISEVTGLPLGTVKSRLHRARLALKEALEERTR